MDLAARGALFDGSDASFCRAFLDLLLITWDTASVMVVPKRKPASTAVFDDALDVILVSTASQSDDGSETQKIRPILWLRL